MKLFHEFSVEHLTSKRNWRAQKQCSVALPDLPSGVPRVVPGVVPDLGPKVLQAGTPSRFVGVCCMLFPPNRLGSPGAVVARLLDPWLHCRAFAKVDAHDLRANEAKAPPWRPCRQMDAKWPTFISVVGTSWRHFGLGAEGKRFPPSQVGPTQFVRCYPPTRVGLTDSIYSQINAYRPLPGRVSFTSFPLPLWRTIQLHHCETRFRKTRRLIQSTCASFLHESSRATCSSTFQVIGSHRHLTRAVCQRPCRCARRCSWCAIHGLHARSRVTSSTSVFRKTMIVTGCLRVAGRSYLKQVCSPSSSTVSGYSVSMVSGTTSTKRIGGRCTKDCVRAGSTTTSSQSLSTKSSTPDLTESRFGVQIKASPIRERLQELLAASVRVDTEASQLGCNFLRPETVLPNFASSQQRFGIFHCTLCTDGTEEVGHAAY